MIQLQDKAEPLQQPKGRVTTQHSRSAIGQSAFVPYLYLLPALIVYSLFAILPVLSTFQVSFLKWDGVSPGEWVGFRNYIQILADPALRSSLIHSFKFIFFYSIVPGGLGLILANTMTRRPIHAMTAFRTILFLPQTLALVVVAIAWRWLYAPEGSLNEFLRLIGLSSLTRFWLGDFQLALPALGVVGTWVMYPLAMILFLAGIQKIPRDLYDASRVDGAGPLQEFLHVTLPGVKHEMTVIVTLTVIFAMRNFDIVFTTTRGGPGTTTTTPALIMYLYAFQFGQVGQGAAIGIFLTVLIFIMSYVITRLFSRGD